MAIEDTTTVESFGEESYHRLYIPKNIRRDSDYPLAAGRDVRLRAVGPLLLVVPERRGSLVDEIADVVEREVL